MRLVEMMPRMVIMLKRIHSVRSYIPDVMSVLLFNVVVTVTATMTMTDIAKALLYISCNLGF